MISGKLASFLKVAAVAVVTGFAVALLAAACGGGDDNSPLLQAETTLTVTIRPESTAQPTATQEPVPTDPPTATALPPTQPPPTDVPPAPTLDTRVAIMDRPTLYQIQLGKDGKYFIADRGDGCTWVEVFRGTTTFQAEETLQVTLQTDCPVDFTYAFLPDKGEVNVQVW